MTLVSSANSTGSDTKLMVFSGEGHLYILQTTEALELFLGELQVSTYPREKILSLIR